jgi:hypothetical protein
LGGKILPNFDLKNMILRNGKDFSFKKKESPNLPDFKEKIIQVDRSL